jgi:hypothetical protein
MILALVALTTAVGSAPAEAAPGRYEIHATMVQNGKILCDPRLIANAGETAAFVTGNGQTTYDLKVIARPDVGHAAAIDRLSLAVEFAVDGPGSGAHVETTVIVRPGEPVTVTLPASETSPPVAVSLSADKI